MVGRAWSAGLAIIASASIACSAPKPFAVEKPTSPVLSSAARQLIPRPALTESGATCRRLWIQFPSWCIFLRVSTRASTRYPVVYLIHSASADASQWFDIGIAGNTDTLVADGAIAPSLWVMASFGDRSTSEIARSLVASIVPWATKALPTIDDADHRAVGGISQAVAHQCALRSTTPPCSGPSRATAQRCRSL